MNLKKWFKYDLKWLFDVTLKLILWIFLFPELIPKPAVSYEDPPLYLCIRLGKPIRGEISQTCPIAAYSKQKKKPEYWFSIPREK